MSAPCKYTSCLELDQGLFTETVDEHVLDRACSSVTVNVTTKFWLHGAVQVAAKVCEVEIPVPVVPSPKFQEYWRSAGSVASSVLVELNVNSAGEFCGALGVIVKLQLGALPVIVTLVVHVEIFP